MLVNGGGIEKCVCVWGGGGGGRGGWNGSSPALSDKRFSTSYSDQLNFCVSSENV